jgi:copper chaperone CopZ
MKKSVFVIIMALGLSVFGTSVNAQETAGVKSDTVKYWVSMTCENCVAKIEKNIAFEKGVKDLVVDLKTKTVTISYKNKKTNPDKLEKAIKDLGYTTERIEEGKAGGKTKAEGKETKGETL